LQRLVQEEVVLSLENHINRTTVVVTPLGELPKETFDVYSSGIFNILSLPGGNNGADL